MAAITGKGARLHLATSTGSSAAVLVAEQLDYSLEMDQGIEDVSALGSTWATHVLSGSRKYTASMKGNFDTASVALWDAASLQKPVRFYIYPEAASSEYFCGTAWVKLGQVIAGGNTAAPKTSATLTGDGELIHAT